jgi:LDH2 family malate/lactate/ureidoglycolate dehydrogenase
VRLPGARRRAIADSAAAEGVEVPPALLDELRILADAA